MIDSKLITLLMVNELHSFTQAAKKLSLTQPAVSQHVRQLEKELGVTIFARGEGNLKLTREGEIVIKYAKRIDSLYQNLEQSLKEEKEHARKITVGITHTSESNIMVEVLARYSSVSKKTRITIISDTINNLSCKQKNPPVFAGGNSKRATHRFCLQMCNNSLLIFNGCSSSADIWCKNASVLQHQVYCLADPGSNVFLSDML